MELRDPRRLTRFSDSARQADRHVAGRVVPAGDAAHIHPPARAVGVNVALADAVKLGRKLAATALGHAPDRRSPPAPYGNQPTSGDHEIDLMA